MNLNNLLLLSSLFNRAEDAARAVKQDVHTIIHWGMEDTLLLDLPHFEVKGYRIDMGQTNISTFSYMPL